MNLYALVEYNRVVQLKESEVMPEAPASPTSIWVDVTGSTDMRVGWGATFNGIWTFSAPTDEELRNEAEQQKWQLLNVAANWLLMNSLQFKVDLAVASAEEQARLLAHKQYCIALSDVDKQSGYPTNIMWPVAPY
ncbi:MULTISPECIES: tail fiber assembly protein [unclassified Pseudomonas]|uniref:tail fiber assembly protein n=1 Tax=unclassified Pseudomonas TaxID=196821 RepID=UPI00164504D8|nr:MULTISPECIES: tail fiber assembly protein [unclassified Pseudomonas]MBC3270801.1 tail fiber assembly protein [Pseudomonas sp. SWRI81]MBC3775146.1 tail fiber assembly protein [Pseudomonas sp. SWRI99]